MSKYNLRNGMLLYCKDGQTVQLASFSDTHIRVIYKGKIHERPISVLNERLFFVRSCAKIVSIDSKKTEESIIKKHPQKFINRSEDFSYDNSKMQSAIVKEQPQRTTDKDADFSTANIFLPTVKSEETWKKSCRNCKFQISGECSSWDLCDDYQPVYSPPKSETDYYPKYGDATMFKKKGRKK